MNKIIKQTDILDAYLDNIISVAKEYGKDTTGLEKEIFWLGKMAELIKQMSKGEQ